MAEKNGMEMLSSLMGEQGQDALQMMRRMERLKRLMGSAEKKEPPEPMPETDLFSRNRQENMLSAAIPFLDKEYQKDLYIIVRLMEMRRVLQSGFLEVRERQEEPPSLRRRKLLGVLQGYLPAAERQQMETMLKVMDVREIMGREEKK